MFHCTRLRTPVPPVFHGNIIFNLNLNCKHIAMVRGKLNPRQKEMFTLGRLPY